MTIDEAILILEPSEKRPMFLDKSKIIEATKLGIEALKCIQSHRQEFGNIPYTGLPSETKE